MKLLAATALAFAVGTAGAAAQSAPASDEGGPVETSPSPSPPPKAFRTDGYLRSFYFTRQNASNNPGTRFDAAPNSKYNANAVNQATWSTGIGVHGDYGFPGAQWNAGATYVYANPIDGPCVVPANHAKGGVCVSAIPPDTNADDTLPGFTLSTFDEAYVAYKAYGFNGVLGRQLFASPWANPSDSRVKPAAFEGADLAYSAARWTFEAADMLAFEDRTSSVFSRQTLLTSYPAGGKGLPDNIVVPGGNGIETSGFVYAKLGYTQTAPGTSLDAYFYEIGDLATVWWFSGKDVFHWGSLQPFLALQGGVERNGGRSVLGKIRSQDIGAQAGIALPRGIQVSIAFDDIPWRTDAVVLPKSVSCNDGNHQIVTKGATLAYFLPLNAGQCSTDRNGGTRIYYGGWASPYTDGYSTDPLFTTSVTQGMADRRAPGTSWKVALTYTSANKKFVFAATDGWYNYGNALAAQNTNVWTLDGRYYFSEVTKEAYRGLLLRYRYAQRTQSNTYCGASATQCPAGLTNGAAFLGGFPLFKYNRAQLEYDF